MFFSFLQGWVKEFISCSLTDIQIPFSILPLSPTKLSSDQRPDTSFILQRWLFRHIPDGNLKAAFSLLISFPIRTYSSPSPFQVLFHYLLRLKLIPCVILHVGWCSVSEIKAPCAETCLWVSFCFFGCMWGCIITWKWPKAQQKTSFHEAPWVAVFWLLLKSLLSVAQSCPWCWQSPAEWQTLSTSNTFLL